MKTAIVCYLPPKRPQTVGFLKHFLNVKSSLPVIFFGETKYDLQNWHKIDAPVPGLKYAVDMRESDSYAAQNFCNCIKLASELGLERILYIEDDCAFAQDNWDAYYVEQYERTPTALCGGTPVIFNPIHATAEWLSHIIEYSHFYQISARMPIALEGSQPQFDWRFKESPHVFPNGALAMYDVAMLRDAFKEPLADFVTYRNNAFCFDQVVGLYLTKKYGVNVFSKIAVVPCVYSGCGEHYLTDFDRRELIRLGKKMAVHKWSFV